MNRAVQLAQRARGKYLKPELPEGPFVIMGPDGRTSGAYFPDQLIANPGLKGEPWGFFDGSPRIFRVRKQVGMVMTCDDGSYTILPVQINPERI